MRSLNPHEERQIAVLAGVDPRTVRAVLAGRAVRSTCAARVIAALRETGRADLIPLRTPPAEEDAAPRTADQGVITKVAT